MEILLRDMERYIFVKTKFKLSLTEKPYEASPLEDDIKQQLHTPHEWRCDNQEGSSVYKSELERSAGGGVYSAL